MLPRSLMLLNIVHKMRSADLCIMKINDYKMTD